MVAVICKLLGGAWSRQASRRTRLAGRLARRGRRLHVPSRRRARRTGARRRAVARASWSRARLRRIDELEPEINAFTHVAHESALARGASDRRRAIRGRSPACRSRSRTTGPWPGCRSRCAATCSATTWRRPRRVPRARLREAGFVIVGKTTLPEMGILPDDRAAPVRPDAQPVGSRPHAGRLDRRLGGGGRGRDGADRPRQRRRRLDSDPGRLLRSGRAEGAARPRLGRARRRPGFLAIDGVLTRTVAETAQLLDVIAGYERRRDLGAAPAEPFAAARARRAAGGCGSASALDAAARTGAALDPVCERGARDAAALLGVARPRRRGDRAAVVGPRTCSPDFRELFGPRSRR